MRFYQIEIANNVVHIDRESPFTGEDIPCKEYSLSEITDYSRDRLESLLRETQERFWITPHGVIFFHGNPGDYEDSE